MESLPEWVEWCFVVASQWTLSLGFCCLTFPSVEQMCCPRDWLILWGSEGGVPRRSYKNTWNGNDGVPAPSLEHNWILDFFFFFFNTLSLPSLPSVLAAQQSRFWLGFPLQQLSDEQREHEGSSGMRVWTFWAQQLPSQPGPGRRGRRVSRRSARCPLGSRRVFCYRQGLLLFDLIVSVQKFWFIFLRVRLKHLEQCRIPDYQLRELSAWLTKFKQ